MTAQGADASAGARQTGEALATLRAAVSARVRCDSLAVGGDYTAQAIDAFCRLDPSVGRPARARVVPLSERVRADGARVLRQLADEPEAPGLEGECQAVCRELSALAAVFASAAGGKPDAADTHATEYRAICGLLSRLRERAAFAEPVWRALGVGSAAARARPPPRGRPAAAAATGAPPAASESPSAAGASMLPAVTATASAQPRPAAKASAVPRSAAGAPRPAEGAPPRPVTSAPRPVESAPPRPAVSVPRPAASALRPTVMGAPSRPAVSAARPAVVSAPSRPAAGAARPAASAARPPVVGPPSRPAAGAPRPAACAPRPAASAPRPGASAARPP